MLQNMLERNLRLIMTTTTYLPSITSPTMRRRSVDVAMGVRLAPVKSSARVAGACIGVFLIADIATRESRSDP